MQNILRDTHQEFQNVHNLLQSNTLRNSTYYAHLNEVTQDAYISMNEMMHANTTICNQCAGHRDFLHSMFNILEELETGSSLSPIHEEKLNIFSVKVTDILKKISAALTSL